MNNNPFVVRDQFAKDFINSIGQTFVKFNILKGTDGMKNLSYQIGRDGKVTFLYEKEIHHPAGFHMVGSCGPCDFATFSDWDEWVQASNEWDCIQDVSWNSRKADTDCQCFLDFMALWNAVFFIPREKLNLNYTLYDYVIDVVDPAFRKIQKYW